MSSTDFITTVYWHIWHMNASNLLAVIRVAIVHDFLLHDLQAAKVYTTHRINLTANSIVSNIPG